MGATRSRNRVRYITIAAVLILLVGVVFMGSRIGYTVGDENIKISWLTGITIPIEDITEVRILDETPEMHRDFGIAILNIRQGTYSVAGIGKVKIYSGDINRKLVIIRTADETYGITPENPEEFVKSLDRE